MSVPDRHGVNKRHDGYETVLVLTDGSNRAERMAGWGLVFAELSRTTIHRIDVIECLDSGMIIHRYEESVETERGDRGLRLADAATADEIDQYQIHGPIIDVLHGVPHEVLLDYIAANAIDIVIIGVCERTRLNRSFVGRTFTTISQAATVPVILIGGTEELSETRRSTDGEKQIR